MTNRSAVPRVLLIEDDPILSGALLQRLRLEGFAVDHAPSCAEALQALRRVRPDFVLSDIRLPDGSGETLYRQIMPYLGQASIVFATAFADVKQAVRLMRAGADDYLIKPFDVDELVRHIRTLVHAEGELPKDEKRFGLSPATLQLEADLHRLSIRDVPVLLTGETGVGKEVAARILHDCSPRANEPFVAVNCGGVPRDLMESQFFGHERGAFTGAHSAHVGFFEETGKGTLFLDEIGDLELQLQASLLRVLQDGFYRRLGARQDKRFEGRIVAATNADLTSSITARKFREDLYFRLAVVEVRIPPLRQRRDEIMPLAQSFLAHAAKRQDLPVPEIKPDVRAVMLAHDWPGNVRELRNRVERAVALSDEGHLVVSDLFPERVLDESVPASTLADVRAQVELAQIERALELSGGKVAEAAAQLGISRTTLWKRRKRAPSGGKGG